MTEVPDRIRAVFAAHRTLVIATVDAQGQPDAVSVFFTPEYRDGGVSLVCALLSTSEKLAHLRQNPRAGLYIGPQSPAIWLQARATAAVIEDEPERTARLAQLVAGTPEAAVVVERVPVTAVLFHLTRVKLTDLTRGQPPVEVVEFPVHG